MGLGLNDVRVGRCHRLPPHNALVCAMGTHMRLGSAAPTAVPDRSSSHKTRLQKGKVPAAADTSMCCVYATMPVELVHRVVEACVSWPEGQAGELEGVMRLLGGMTRCRTDDDADSVLIVCYCMHACALVAAGSAAI